MGGVGKVPYPRYIKAEIASPLRINRVELIKNGEFLKAIPEGDNLRISYIKDETIFEDTEPSGEGGPASQAAPTIRAHRCPEYE